MGQDQSLPGLPSGTTELLLAGKKLEGLPYDLPPDSPIVQIDCSKNQIQKFPLNLQNVKCINLSGNNLGEILEKNPDIEIDFPNLNTLILSENEISHLPKCFGSLKKLKQLSLEKNDLTKLDCDLPELEHLNLLINYFQEIPNLPESLLTLNLSFNNIKILSFGLPNLRELNLSGNEIREISNDISFPSLVTLDLSFNSISSIPPITNFAPNLEVMLLSYNFLDAFPTYLPLSIKRIDVSHNLISSWEDPVVHLLSLSLLDISYNMITEVPELPPNLEVFIPHHNQIKKVFPITSEALRRVIISDNNLQQIPNISGSNIENLHCERNMLDAVNTENLSQDIKILDVSGCYIGEFPLNICDFQNLQLLDLSTNHICKIPDDIKKMNSLKYLLLNENPISSLPSLPNSLQTLACCKCQFTDLPYAVYNVDNLTRIDFSCNRITKIHSFPNVPYINLSCNHIKKLPQLPNCITSFLVAHNDLQKFSLERDYESLQELDISHNQISQLSLKPMYSLKSFKLGFNPLKYEIDYSYYPCIDSIDVCEIQCTFPSSAPPQQLRELVSSDQDWFSKTTNAQYKLFQCQHAGYSQQPGTKQSMEDTLIVRNCPQPSLYAVIDGHGGNRTSSLAAYLIPLYFQKLENKSISGISEVLKKLNDQLRKFDVTDGATLVICFVAMYEIGCAHVGDARALVVKKDGKIVQLTNDHKATDRTEFGIVKENRALLSSGRLNGTLAVSRAIGDFAIEGVMRTPSMTVYPIDQANDIRLVLACDGIFNVMSNEEVGRIAAEQRDVHNASAIIRNLAYARGAQNNLSVIVVDICQNASK